jgi:hypothetical protein
VCVLNLACRFLHLRVLFFCSNALWDVCRRVLTSVPSCLLSFVFFVKRVYSPFFFFFKQGASAVLEEIFSCCTFVFPCDWLAYRSSLSSAFLRQAQCWQRVRRTREKEKRQEEHSNSLYVVNTEGVLFFFCSLPPLYVLPKALVCGLLFLLRVCSL